MPIKKMSDAYMEMFSTTATGRVKFWVDDAVSGAITVIADGEGDVTQIATFLYAVHAVTGGDAMGGVVALEPGDSFELYNDGGDSLTLAVAANGSVTVTEVGGDTFNVVLLMIWI